MHCNDVHCAVPIRPSEDRHSMWCASVAGDTEDMPLSVPAPCTLLALDNNMDTGHGEWRMDTSASKSSIRRFIITEKGPY